jgi:site-specific DNA recombinase
MLLPVSSNTFSSPAMRYLIYARKSSESEEKQAQSIDDQLNDLRVTAQQRGLEVVGELTEARSAKAPGCRPVFAELIARLHAGEAEAILCWHVNRLFRNPVDFGTISWMLQTGALKEIHTPHQIHRSGDNVLLLSVENGMANQYILDLRRAVERGIRSRLEKGWYPHKAPEGYINRGATIEKDPERFDTIRQVFQWVLTGEKSVREILTELESRGYTTKQSQKTRASASPKAAGATRATGATGGGSKIAMATLYNILSNIFYAGYFVRAGETYPGAHEPMITLSEFLRVQAILKGRTKRRRIHTFAYSGLITCGDCGCQIVGEYKRKIMASGKVHDYTYYSCSNAKGGCRRTVIREEEITGQIARVLKTLWMPVGFVEYAGKAIARWKEEAMAEHQAAKAKHAETLAVMEGKRTKLLDLRLSELLSDEEYREEKKRLTNQISQTRMEQQVGHEATDALWESMENAVSLLHYGKELFESGLPALQNRIAQTLGAQYVLTRGSLSIELKPVFGRLYELQAKQRSEAVVSQEQDRVGEENALKKSLESGSYVPDTALPYPERLTWWDTLESIRTGFMASKADNLILRGVLWHAQDENGTDENGAAVTSRDNGTRDDDTCLRKGGASLRR